MHHLLDLFNVDTSNGMTRGHYNRLIGLILQAIVWKSTSLNIPIIVGWKPISGDLSSELEFTDGHSTGIKSETNKSKVATNK